MFELNHREKNNELKALLIGVYERQEQEPQCREMLAELQELADTCGIKVHESLAVRVRQRHPGLLLGKGKAEEIFRFVEENEIDMIIFDEPLTPVQQRNWEKATEIRVLDRQEIILSIFAQRAKTKEAELQIRLAQAEYMLPRIRRLWTHLDRQRGGVGLRAGEGEKQIEIDRRILKRDIAQLKSELAKVQRQRAQQRKQRQRVPVPVASLVGYTNAGKSSLLNHLTRAEVLVENKLFATLDPTTRRLELPSGQTLLLTDTVGFIRNLPHSLVEAFKATLEEAVQADFLIHVVDVSSTQWREHIAVTVDVLREIGAGEHLRLLVFNKIDLVDPHQLRRLRREYQEAVFVSVKTGEGIEELKQELAAILQRDLETVQLAIPHERSDLVARIHEQAVVTQIRYEDHHIFIEARIPQKMKKELQPFIGAATYSL